MVHVPARIIRDYYAEYSPAMLLTCSDCGWHGAAEDAPMEMYDQLFDRSCPCCDKMLLIVGYPTTEQTKAAAEIGNDKAIANCRAYGIKFGEG